MVSTDTCPASRVEAAEPVRLDTLDTATLRALCDGGWLDHASYVSIAQARGVQIPQLPAEVAAAPGERTFVVTLPGDARASDLALAVKPLGGHVAAAFDHPTPGTLTLPVLDTRMQHQRPRETPTISIA